MFGKKETAPVPEPISMDEVHERAIDADVLIQKSRSLSNEIKEVINSLPDHKPETIAESRIPELETQLQEIDQEIHEQTDPIPHQ
ncbi:MAG: hypothetical protein V4465_01500 [Patescibacteria group bacterium]